MRTIRKGIEGTIGAAILAALSGYAQTNYVIQSPVAAADHTIKISWNSESNAVFQVESADSLTDVGAQGLQWVIRDADVGSKGTNAEWMDVGDPQWLPRIFHPRFQPQRFYRVKKIGQAIATRPTVTVQLSQGGVALPAGTNVISGDLDVSVVVNLVDTNQVISSVKLVVDGQKVISTDYSFSTSINTCEWPNGLHEIYGMATTAIENDIGETTPASDTEADAVTNDVQVAIGVAASKFCVFSNYISQFFVAVPYFQIGQTQEIVATFPEDSYWRVTVVDYQDNPVRQFDGQGSSAYAAWDGTDGSGNSLSYGYYDYIVDARPSQYGPLSIVSPLSSSSSRSAQTSLSSSVIAPPPTGYQLRAAPYKQTPAAMQFSSNNIIAENIVIPSLNPTNAPAGTNDSGGPPSPMMALSLAGYPTSAEEALSQGLTSYFVAPPPMPPVITNIDGRLHAIPWEEVYGPLPPIEIQIPESEQEAFLQKAAGMTPMDGPQPMDNWPDATYETRTPTRTPGNLFFGFAGSVGIGYQGHHPKKPPVFGTAPGGVLASTPPWGPLKTASSLAGNFSANMGFAGWRTSFLKGDDNLNSLDLNPVMGPGTGTGTFATQCHFGFLVGHMTASARNDPNFYATVPYYPVYNSTQPGAYQWIATPDMDLGNDAGSVFSKLKWMAFYGCQSFKERDYSDLWTKFLLPMPPNLRLILGSEDGVFIMPGFGSRFAADLNGWTVPGGNPMTIWEAWCDAAGVTDTAMSHTGWYKLGYPIGTRRMTCIYRDTTQGGSWNTISDSIWGWWSDISYDWFDVSFNIQQVY